MFYELDTFDPFGHNPWKRDAAASPNGTFLGDVNSLARIIKELDPDSSLVEEGKIEDSDAVAAAFLEIPNLLPDG